LIHIRICTKVYVSLHIGCGVKNESGDASFVLNIFWLYILCVYILVTWMLGCRNCLSHVPNFPITSIHTHILKNSKKNFFYFWNNFLRVFHLKTFTRPHSSTWETDGFKGFVANVKCNRDSYNSKLGFSFLLFSISF